MNYFVTKRLGDKEYRVFTPLLYLVAICLVSLCLLGLKENNWSLSPNPYSYCNDVKGCFNGFYNSSICQNSVYSDKPICTQLRLNYDESIGIKSSWLSDNLVYLTTIIFGLWLFVNTILFNREFLRDFKVK